MNAQIECLQTKKPAPILWFQYVLVLILFMVGLFGVIGSFPGIPGSGMGTSSIDSTQKKVDEQKQIIANLNNQLATAKSPKEKARLQNLINGHTTVLKENEAKLAALKASKPVDNSGEGCFTADMLVLTEDGVKPIGEIKMGDRVWSVDSAGNRMAADVLDTYNVRNNHYYLINGKIKVTATHRFFTEDGEKRVRDLEVGDKIQMRTGMLKSIVSIKRFDENLEVYNLLVSQNHNFFVSEDGNNGYLVGNGGK